MKKIFLGLLVVCVGFMLTGCGSSVSYAGIEGYERVEGRETLRIGMECDYPPFNWSQPNVVGTALPIYGQVASLYVDGYDVQIAKHLAKSLEMNVEVYMIPWDNLIIEVEAGNIDLIIAGMSPTDERKTKIDFTDAYYTSDFVIVTTASSSYANATTFAEFEGAKGVGQKETLYEDLVQNMANGDYGNTNVTAALPASTVPLISLGLTNGDYDFTILEKPVADSLIATNSNLKIVAIAGDNPFNVSDEDRTVSIGVAKGKQDLVTRLNRALDLLSSTERNAIMSAAVQRA